jgi:beta-lactamase class D
VLVIRFGLFLLVLLISACASVKYHGERAEVLELKTAYDKVNSQGVFLLKGQKKEGYHYFNPLLADSLYSPTSTFKIVISIIALETGIVKTIHDTVFWDGVIRERKEWNKDTDMKSAFANSTVWYFQQVARKIGTLTMQQWLDSLDYGAGAIKTIDKFWMNNELKISPHQQLEFLEKFALRKLMLRTETYAALEEIMQKEVRGNSVLYAKTGWGFDGRDLGWYVGYVRSSEGVYPFVNLMISGANVSPDFASARIYIVRNVLNNLGIMPL